MNPSPTVKGARQVQVKASLSRPSLSHLALGSQGTERHGSGTEYICILLTVTTYAISFNMNSA